jgi:hypothetical protein
MGSSRRTAPYGLFRSKTAVKHRIAVSMRVVDGDARISRLPPGRR